MFLKKRVSCLAGIICGLSFAPIYFTPAILMISVLCRQLLLSNTRKQAVYFGYWFGFGFFLSTLYWICFGVSVYIEQFWWAIPFALFGLPAFLALFIAMHAMVAWSFRNNFFYHFLFCCTWLFFEWLLSWLFTGLPWGMMGYALTISDTLIQSASIFGILGLSFATLYIASSFFTKKMLCSRIVIASIICIVMLVFGHNRLESTPTRFSDIKIRIVQPSIPQHSKWNPKIFWQNLDNQIALSQAEGEPDIILWSEAALTVPYYFEPIHNALMSVFTKDNQVLLSGGVGDNRKTGAEHEIYSSLIAMSNEGSIMFDYHKSHLVPFGEYIPFGNYLPIKKITSGITDYTSGKREIVYLKSFNLYIHPLVCYESIFFDEVRISNIHADVMINVTNDAWYGKSSGPYQHFEISRMRSIENGLPMVRAANNGISAIIDPVGRVIKRLELNEINILDGYIPLKIDSPTIYSTWGNIPLLIFILLVLGLTLIQRKL